MLRSPTKYDSDSEISKTKDKVKSPKEPSFSNSRFKRPRPDVESDWKNAIKTFKDDIMELFQNLKEDIHLKFSKIEKSLNDIQANHLDFEKSLEFLSSNYEDMSVKIAGLETKSKENYEYILSLEDKIEELTRNHKSSYIELRNVPIQENEKNEDRNKYVLNAFKTVKLESQSSDIREVYRRPGKNQNRQAIIVGLSSPSLKYDLLKAAKIYNLNNPNNKLNSQHLGIKNQISPIYISEHLTTKSKRLFYLGRQMTKTNQYKFCWTSNGKVFLRKTEGSPAIILKNEEQIETLKLTA